MESIEKIKTGGGRLAAVVGMFDGVHLGHRFLIDRLKEEATRRGLLPAVFTFPGHPLSVVNPSKAPRLLTDPAEKLRLLVDAGIPAGRVGYLVFDDRLRRLPAAEFLKMLHDRYHVDFILRGFNNRFGTERDLTPEDYRLTAAGVGIELIDATGLCLGEGAGHLPVSSSRIREALANGDLLEANRMSGKPYRMTGTVVGGKHLGRTIGFPTANLRPLHASKMIPADGVYLCLAYIDGAGPRRAIVNIGTRPTVDGPNSRRTIEAHIIDFDKEIYGRQVTLEFIHRLRSEIKFPSPSDLARQLEADRESARNFPILG